MRATKKQLIRDLTNLQRRYTTLANKAEHTSWLLGLAQEKVLRLRQAAPPPPPAWVVARDAPTPRISKMLVRSEPRRKWLARLAAAKIRGQFSTDDHMVAAGTRTCPAAEIAGRYGGRLTPEWLHLWSLGNNFLQAVRDDDVPMAHCIFTDMEDLAETIADRAGVPA